MGEGKLKRSIVILVERKFGIFDAELLREPLDCDIRYSFYRSFYREPKEA